MDTVGVCFKESILEAKLRAEIFGGRNVMSMVLYCAANAVDLNVTLIPRRFIAAVYRLALCSNDLHLCKPVIVDAEATVKAGNAVITLA